MFIYEKMCTSKNEAKNFISHAFDFQMAKMIYARENVVYFTCRALLNMICCS